MVKTDFVTHIIRTQSTENIMKTTIATFLIATVSLFIASCGGNDRVVAEATPAQGSVHLVFNEMVPLETSLDQWLGCLVNAGNGDTITVTSGPMRRSASFKITPELALTTGDNRIDRASASAEIAETTKLLQDISGQRESSISLPKLLTLVRENMASDTRRVMITSSTLNQDREEPAFSFNEGRFPSDGHLQATINETPFATKGDLLSNVRVDWNDTSVDADFMNDIHRASVRRFVTAWIQGQGASIQYGSLATEHPVALDSQDTTVEMRVAPTRSVRVVSQPSMPSAPAAPKPKQTDGIRESLKELRQVNLEINFDLDSDHIREESAPLLESAAAALRDPSYQFTKFVVEGHTSPEGTAQHNQRLSERRAGSVRDALIRSGVDASRVSAIGYGSSRPLTLNVGPQEGSPSANRRVVLRIVDANVAKQN